MYSLACLLLWMSIGLGLCRVSMGMGTVSGPCVKGCGTSVPDDNSDRGSSGSAASFEAGSAQDHPETCSSFRRDGRLGDAGIRGDGTSHGDS